MLSNFSVKKSYTVVVFIIIIAILGGVAYFNMSVDLLPNMNLPYIAIIVVAPGSAPEDVENSICMPIEQQMATIDNVKKITSSSNEHYGLILMEFSGKANLDSATLDIQSKLVQVKSKFPEMAMDPMIFKLDPTMLPIMSLAISKEGATINDSSAYLEAVGKQLLSVEGVASVSYEGLIDNMVLVMLDNNLIKRSITEQLAPNRDTFVDEAAYQEAVSTTPPGEPLPDRDLFVNEIAYRQAVLNIEMLASFASGLIGSMLQPELVGMALYAQNFNMPAGNVSIDGINYLVKIGDKIHSYDDLNNMSIMSIDFKKMIDNYDQIIDLLRGLSVNQTTLDTLKSLKDEDGTAKTIVKTLGSFFENLEDSPYFEKIVDPITGVVTYEVTQSLVDGLAAIGATSEALEEFVLPAESLETITLIDSLIDFFDTFPDTEDIIDQLTEIKSTLVALRQLVIGGGILVPETRVDEFGNPVFNDITGEPYMDYVINRDIIALVALFTSISEGLDGIIISEAQINDLITTINGLNSVFDDIANFAEVSENFLQNPVYFQKVYRKDIQGNYLDSEGNITTNPDEYVVLRYQINTAFVDTLKALPPMTFKVKDMAHAVVLNTAGNQFAIVNGTAGVMISIQKQSDVSTVTVSKGIRAKLAEIGAKDSGFSYIMLMDQGEYITYMINAIIKNLLFGALFAILVLWFFLKRIKPTLIVGASIFISVVTAFILMYFAGITLNIISMGGLALGVGMLVDNSIVVIENIYRKREEGESVLESCVQGAKQVSGAIIASTLTTVIIFLPIVFIEGITKQLFIDIAYTIAFSLAASLVVALTFVPMATSKILKKDKQNTDSMLFDKFKDLYAKTMVFFLNKRWVVIATVTILFFTSIGSIFFMNRIFFPPSDMGYVTITARVQKDKLPRDMSYEEATGIIVDYLDSIIGNQYYVKDLGIEVSSGLSMLGISQGNEYINAYVVLIDDSKRASANEIVDDILNKVRIIPGLPEDAYEIWGTSESMDMGFVGEKTLTFNVYGEELDDTRQAAKEIAILFASVNGVDPAKIDNGVGKPPIEYQLIIDPEKASPYGVYVAQALQTMQKVLAPPTASTKVKFDSTRLTYDVIVYGTEYQLIRWYKAFDNGGNVIKVFINYDGTYYVENTLAINEAKRKVNVTRVVDGDDLTNEFRYTIDNIEYSVLGEGDNLIVYYSVGRINDIDLVTYPLTSIVMPGTEYEYTVNVPLYKILKDESFLKDENGDVIYRVNEDENGMPIYLKDEWGDFILDEFGNRIPDYVFDGDGNKIPLSIAMKDGYLSIFHENGTRRLSVSVGIKQDANTDKVLAACRKVIDNYTPPAGVIIEVQGESEIITEAYKTLILVLILGVILIYLVMVAQFQSLKSPLIVMFTVPLAFTGSVFAILISGQPISIVALVGLVILMGIVVNNGIVFVDYVNQLIGEGIERKKALIKAGRDRIRPILMTALTTIFALMVMAFDNSAQGAMMQPMAIATIGGMVYATMLTVYFVPIMFDIFNKNIGNKEEVKTSVGYVYKASLEMQPYTEIEKYKNEVPYDVSLLKSIRTKSLSMAKMLEIYEKNAGASKND